MNFRRIILTFTAALLTSHASASFISIDSIPSVSVEGGKVTAVLRLQNLGDEPAYEVQASASCAGMQSSSPVAPKLPPGGTLDLSSVLGPTPAPDGIYTVVYKISYKDSAGGSFSALNTISLVTDLDSPPPRPLKVKIDSITFDRKAELTPIVTSDRKLGRINVTLFVPDELKVKPESRSLELESDSDAEKLFFALENRTANPGSTYLALIVTDYELNGMHISKATPFNIEVTSAVSASQSPALFVLLGVLILWGTAFQFPQTKKLLRVSEKTYPLIETAMLIISVAAVEFFLFNSLQPKYLFMDTTTVGGDVPAHNYIASHLRESLFGHGRIVSWAGGWWCGFPMFQFYFSLPYIMIVLLDLILPFNIAFKIISVTGILALPLAAWGAARLMKLRKPVPALFALFTIPLLFDHSHEMWGVNIYSTLAGMISNSLSFPLMLLYIASAWRDSEDQRFRPGTVLLLAAVLASHFFTSIVGIITVCIMPFLRRRSDILKSMSVLAYEILLALALMAWWIVPLIAKMEYTADFGTNWPDIAFFKQLPPFAIMLSPLLIPATLMIVLRKTRAVIVFIWMLAAAVSLFFFGFEASNVFVNVRLWPFIVCSIILLEAAGLGCLLSMLPAKRALMPACAAAVLLFAVDAPNHVSHWAKWNFEGLESKQHYSVFEKLVLPLEGTAGRLANDLCHENNMLGSSRIFELAPHLAKKPVLEGGIVNSAAGSMFSYYIQGETSENAAGFPSNVKPPSFNITNATRHLELFNVKHFIARWETTRQAMTDHKDWRFVGRDEQWELFELMSHDGNYVFVPDYMPVAVELHPDILDWKTAGLEWIYNFESVDQHFMLLPPGADKPDNIKSISPSRYLAVMQARDRDLIKNIRDKSLPDSKPELLEYSDYAIAFKTSRPGIPHIIKSTWYPNWKAATGETVYMVTPCFMMVIPSGNEVRLVYSRTAPDLTGIGITSMALIILLALCTKKLLNNKEKVT